MKALCTTWKKASILTVLDLIPILIDTVDTVVKKAFIFVLCNLYKLQTGKPLKISKKNTSVKVLKRCK